jgi:hypothetical protein
MDPGFLVRTAMLTPTPIRPMSMMGLLDSFVQSSVSADLLYMLVLPLQ